MKKIVLLFFLFSSIIFCQEIKQIPLGNISLEELKMTHYEKDSSANAVILLEQGFTHVVSKKKYRYSKKYYVKIKILNKSAFNLATIEIPYLKINEVKNIKGITYNLSENDKIEKSILTSDNIFSTKFNKIGRISSFSLPNVKVGSIIEYSFTLNSDSYSLYDWKFQSDIPKIKSIYRVKIPQFPVLNIVLFGYLKLDLIKEAEELKCYGKYKCEFIHYEMNDIPRFVEENYLDNKNNYISKLIFEEEYLNLFGHRGRKEKNGWDYLDLYFKNKYDNYLKKTTFFRSVLPNSIKRQPDTLAKIKKTFNFIRDHYSLDNSSNFSLIKSFKKRTGNANTINLALYNTLKTLKLNPKIAFLSTRDNGAIIKLHPSLKSMNYSVTFIKVNGEKYFLDATNKNNSFGLVPFKCLNNEARVLDFEKGSYWEEIKSISETSDKTGVFLELNEKGQIRGNIRIQKKGQTALLQRNIMRTLKKSDYIDTYEDNNINLEIEEYSLKNLTDVSKPILENFKISLENEIVNENLIRINPFIINRLEENPFKLKERKYPVNFGFPFSKIFTVILKYSDSYKLVKIPIKKGFKLPNNGGKLIFKVSEEKNRLNLYFKYELNKKAYSISEYNSLKEFFNQIVKSQELFIELEKK